VACVAVVYRLRRAAQADKDLQQALQRELKLELEGRLPFWRRVAQAESLWTLGLVISAGLAQGQDLGTVGPVRAGRLFPLTRRGGRGVQPGGAPACRQVN